MGDEHFRTSKRHISLTKIVVSLSHFDLMQHAQERSSYNANAKYALLTLNAACRCDW